MTEKEILQKLDEVLAINEKLRAENERNKDLLEMFTKGEVRNVELGCNAVYGVTLLSSTGDIEIDMKYDETVSLSATDIQSLLKRSATRKLFVNGIVYFVDEKEYENFSVRRRCNINSDHILKAFKSRSVTNLIKFFDMATSNKMDFDVMNILFYKIIDMDLHEEFGEINHKLRVATEEYFGMDMDMASRLYVKVKSFL